MSFIDLLRPSVLGVKGSKNSFWKSTLLLLIPWLLSILSYLNSPAFGGFWIFYVLLAIFSIFGFPFCLSLAHKIFKGSLEYLRFYSLFSWISIVFLPVGIISFIVSLIYPSIYFSLSESIIFSIVFGVIGLALAVYSLMCFYYLFKSLKSKHPGWSLVVGMGFTFVIMFIVMIAFLGLFLTGGISLPHGSLNLPSYWSANKTSLYTTYSHDTSKILIAASPSTPTTFDKICSQNTLNNLSPQDRATVKGLKQGINSQGVRTCEIQYDPSLMAYFNFLDCGKNAVVAFGTLKTPEDVNDYKNAISSFICNIQ